jgi:DMSO/TMAO reductase YedYZ heme-binding membrane subunit
MKLKDFILSVIAFLILTAAFYAFFSFVSLSLDPSEWHWISRALFGFLELLCFYYSFIED